MSETIQNSPESTIPENKAQSSSGILNPLGNSLRGKALAALSALSLGGCGPIATRLQHGNNPPICDTRCQEKCEITYGQYVKPGTEPSEEILKLISGCQRNCTRNCYKVDVDVKVEE